MSYTVSAKDVQSLRARSGAEMLECKRSLELAHGDADVAMTILRQASHGRGPLVESEQQEAAWFRWLRDNPQSAAWLLAQTAINYPYGPNLSASMASGHVVGVMEDAKSPEYRFRWLNLEARK